MPEALPEPVGDEKLLTVTDIHMPYCRTEGCADCAQRRTLMRRYLAVLDAAGRLRPRPEAEAG